MNVSTPTPAVPVRIIKLKKKTANATPVRIIKLKKKTADEDDGFEACNVCGYWHHYEDKCPNEKTARLYDHV